MAVDVLFSCYKAFPRQRDRYHKRDRDFFPWYHALVGETGEQKSEEKVEAAVDALDGDASRATLVHGRIGGGG